MRVKFILFFKYLIVLVLLHGCGPTSPKDYQTLADSQMFTLAQVLKKVHDPADLKKKQKIIKSHFNKLSSTLIEYRTYLERHPEVSHVEVSKKSDAALFLKKELDRIYELDGGLNLIEEMQKDAYLKLSLFENSLTQERIDMFKSSKPLSKGSM